MAAWRRFSSSAAAWKLAWDVGGADMRGLLVVPFGPGIAPEMLGLPDAAGAGVPARRAASSGGRLPRLTPSLRASASRRARSISFDRGDAPGIAPAESRFGLGACAIPGFA